MHEYPCHYSEGNKQLEVARRHVALYVGSGLSVFLHHLPGRKGVGVGVTPCGASLGAVGARCEAPCVHRWGGGIAEVEASLSGGNAVWGCW